MKKKLIIQPDLFDVEKFNDPKNVPSRQLEDKNEIPLFTPEMIAKLDTKVYIAKDKRFKYENPMVKAYGQLTTQRFLELVRGDNSTMSPLSGGGDIGETTKCSSCEYLCASLVKVNSGDELNIRRKYICGIRGTSCIHRINWPACSKFKFKESISI